MWLGSGSGGGGLVTSIEGQEMEDLKDVSQERNISKQKYSHLTRFLPHCISTLTVAQI